MISDNLWTYRPDVCGSGQTMDIVGFDVEAADGKIGSVDEASDVVGESYIVVDTGPWIFGKKVILPALVVTEVNMPDRKVYVARTKQEIKNAPEFDEKAYKGAGYRERIAGYYANLPGAV
ncbi:PRC-barrel domain containing protein [Sphaerisporangium album]|uniref:PRC-barrel domain containing protein n=1 Tax=Sphaerisporangium album TaxID=509200 RepID=A0A367F959_9ACTN|nr:PRC-barrel domain containing protein [Sphaerisporangium album]RCG26235.1 PRC-barrel domain containing protein [Sphaerisporangium album]